METVSAQVWVIDAKAISSPEVVSLKSYFSSIVHRYKTATIKEKPVKIRVEITGRGQVLADLLSDEGLPVECYLNNQII